MTNKPSNDQGQKNNQLYAATTCSSSCGKCSGQCSKNNNHAGSHNCEAGHQW